MENIETEGIVIGEPEESDYALRRRILSERADEERKRVAGIKKARVQQHGTDDLMKARMGKNWGRR